MNRITFNPAAHRFGRKPTEAEAPKPVFIQRDEGSLNLGTDEGNDFDSDSGGDFADLGDI